MMGVISWLCCLRGSKTFSSSCKKSDCIMNSIPFTRDAYISFLIYDVLYLNMVKVKVKVKVNLSLCLTKHHAMKTYWRSGGITSHILDLSTRWRWVVSFTPWLLYPQGKNPWYPLDRKLGGPQSCSGHGGEEKNSQPLLGIKP
jgi:hypothetical protein